MFWRKTALLAAFLASTAITPALAQEVGVLAAVNRDMTGERPSEPKRQIFLQDKLVTNERIETSADGGGQVLFLDQTSLTITKNSQIILDKYVYNPDQDSGELGVSVLKGAMRMVGGRITKKKPALIKTPSATIGIRGGIGNVTVRPDGSTIYMHVAGISSTIQGVDETLTITREGGVAVIETDGEVEYVGVADSETVNNVFNPKATGEGDGQSTDDDGNDESDSGGQQQGGDDSQQEQEQQRTAQTEAGVEQVAEENSANEETADEAPISTEGERQQRNDDEPDVEVETDAQEEIADNTVEETAEEIAAEIEAGIDQLFFNGTYSPTIVGGAADGVAANLNFQMVFSIDSGEGLVLIELPEAALNGPGGSETFEGDPVFADSFIVGGANPAALTAATDVPTLLGGDAGGVNLTIGADIRVSGDIGVDYQDSLVVNADSLTALIDPTDGVEIDDIGGASASEIVDDFRAVVTEGGIETN